VTVDAAPPERPPLSLSALLAGRVEASDAPAGELVRDGVVAKFEIAMPISPDAGQGINETFQSKCVVVATAANTRACRMALGGKLVAVAFGKARPTSGQEFDAVGVAASPDDLARLPLRVIGYQHQFETIGISDGNVRGDFGAAGRDVQHEAFAPCLSAIDRDPGRLSRKLPPWFALCLCSSPLDSHDANPWLTCCDRSVGIAHHIARDFCKFPLTLTFRY
jgi:hypothetical protein